MPGVAPGSKVLVTGANGFLAIWTIRKLLEAGFSVRGTVRDATRGEFVATMFRSYGHMIEMVVVPDIEVEGTFDEHVKEVDAVAHIASPYHMNAVEPDELFQPAIRGTLSILNSVLKHGTRVKRVVITSSTGAVARQSNFPGYFTDADWNDEAVESVKAEGRDAPNMLKYFASKVLAERAAWDFYERHSGVVGWDLVVLCPPAVLGPSLSEMAGPEAANASMAIIYNAMIRGTMDNATLTNFGNGWIDVRDIAGAHVRALERDEAEGRIIVSAGSFKVQDWLDAAHGLKTIPYMRQPVARGDTTYDASRVVHGFTFDVTKMARTLGMSPESLISMDQCVHDILEDFQQRGW